MPYSIDGGLTMTMHLQLISPLKTLEIQVFDADGSRSDIESTGLNAVLIMMRMVTLTSPIAMTP